MCTLHGVLSEFQLSDSTCLLHCVHPMYHARFWLSAVDAPGPAPAPAPDPAPEPTLEERMKAIQERQEERRREREADSRARLRSLPAVYGARS